MVAMEKEHRNGWKFTHQPWETRFETWH